MPRGRLFYYISRRFVMQQLSLLDVKTCSFTGEPREAQLDYRRFGFSSVCDMRFQILCVCVFIRRYFFGGSKKGSRTGSPSFCPFFHFLLFLSVFFCFVCVLLFIFFSIPFSEKNGETQFGRPSLRNPDFCYDLLGEDAPRVGFRVLFLQ